MDVEFIAKLFYLIGLAGAATAGGILGAARLRRRRGLPPRGNAGPIVFFASLALTLLGTYFGIVGKDKADTAALLLCMGLIVPVVTTLFIRFVGSLEESEGESGMS